MKRYLKLMQRFVDRPWFAFALFAITAADALIVVVPIDAILLPACALVPKRWALFALSVASGSVVGSMMMSWLTIAKGLPFILQYYPGVEHTHAWEITLRFFDHYGLIFIFFYAISPLFQLPAVVAATLAGTPAVPLFLTMFVARALKFLFISYLSSKAPKFFKKNFKAPESD